MLAWRTLATHRQHRDQYQECAASRGTHRVCILTASSCPARLRRFTEIESDCATLDLVAIRSIDSFSCLAPLCIGPSWMSFGLGLRVRLEVRDGQEAVLGEQIVAKLRDGARGLLEHVAMAPDHVWSYDFLSTRTQDASARTTAASSSPRAFVHGLPRGALSRS